MERDVKHGCCSCTHYTLPLKKEPCKSCQRWSNWEDASMREHEEQNGGKT